MAESALLESALLDLSGVSLPRLIDEEGDSVLAAALRRMSDEADAGDRSDVVSAFNSSLD